MISGRLIICIGSAWDYDPTSKHHIMRHFSRENEILWVNYHGTRKPSNNRHDRRGIVRTLKRILSGPRRVSASITEFTPFVIPGATSRTGRKLHESLLIAQIRRAVRGLDTSGRRVQIWTFAPDAPFLKDRFHEECLVYYCTDDHRRFAGFDAVRIAEQENELIDRADAVVTSSQPLYEAHSRRRDDILLLRHGVDYEHFASAWVNPPVPPPDVSDLPRPMIGFFGLIQHWIDVELIARVAELRPQFSFVLIGECKADETPLRRRPNIHLLGRRDYSVLPAYCAAFNAAILPFAQNDMTISVNPVKMYEYLAAGLPVVSTPLPEARRFPGAITIARTPDEFAAACDAAVAIGRCEAGRISALVQNDTWASRVEQLSDHVEREMRARHDAGVGGTLARFPSDVCRTPPLPISSPT